MHRYEVEHQVWAATILPQKKVEHGGSFSRIDLTMFKKNYYYNIMGPLTCVIEAQYINY